MNCQAKTYEKMLKDAYEQMPTMEGGGMDEFQSIVESTGGTFKLDIRRRLVFVDYADGSGLTLYAYQAVHSLWHPPQFPVSDNLDPVKTVDE